METGARRKQVKEKSMKSKVGLWIDHRKAIVVIITNEGEATRQINSNMEKDAQYTGSSRSEGSQKAEDMQDRRYTNRLSRYYDEVIACIRDATSIQIFGPGEAKNELEKRLQGADLAGRFIDVETVDKMTDRQIAAKVRQHLLANLSGHIKSAQHLKQIACFPEAKTS
jgi:hypothetical protein